MPVREQRSNEYYYGQLRKKLLFDCQYHVEYWYPQSSEVDLTETEQRLVDLFVEPYNVCDNGKLLIEAVVKANNPALLVASENEGQLKTLER